MLVRRRGTEVLLARTLKFSTLKLFCETPVSLEALRGSLSHHRTRVDCVALSLIPLGYGEYWLMKGGPMNLQHLPHVTLMSARRRSGTHLRPRAESSSLHQLCLCRGLSRAGFRSLTRSPGCCHAGLEQLHVARRPTRPGRRRVRIRVSCIHAEDGHGEVRLG